MKKFIGLMVLALFSVAMAAGGAAITAPTNTDGYYVEQWAYVTPAKTSQDTMIAVDTTVLFKNIGIPPGGRCILGIVDSLGAADSIKIEYIAYDKGGRTIATAMLDTIVASTSYKEFSMPFNLTVFGSTFTLKAIQMAATSGIRSFIKSATVWSLNKYTLYRIKT